MGSTTTGEVVAAAPDSGVGLDCDKFSKKALDQHFDNFLIPLLNKLKPWCGKTLKALMMDSWEAGKQNGLLLCRVILNDIVDMILLHGYWL